MRAVGGNAFADGRAARAAAAGLAGCALALVAACSRPAPEEALRAAGVDPGARGETLTVDQFARVAEQLPAAGAPAVGQGDA